MRQSRRGFVKQAAGVAAFAAGAPWVGMAAEDAKKVVGNPGWYDRPMRWAQLAFVEDDPGKL